MKMTAESRGSKVANSSDTETSESLTTMKLTRKRKSEDIGANSVDEFPICPEFPTSIPNDKPKIVNCQEAFFDKNSPGIHTLPTDSPAKPFTNNERIIKPSKCFFDDDENVPCEVSRASSPQNSPRAFRQEFHSVSTPTPSHYSHYSGGDSPLVRQEFHKVSTPSPSHFCTGGISFLVRQEFHNVSTPTPSHYCAGGSPPLLRQEFHNVATPTPSYYCGGGGSPLVRPEFHKVSTPTPTHYCTGGGSPLSVVDELFTGFYGCMPRWECSLPWRGDSEDDDDTQEEEEGENCVMRRDMTQHDAEAIREHLSFPKYLGKESASQSVEESCRERNNTSINRKIHRTPSSRLTTLETDSRQKLPGSKMFRRTEISKVTEIHWDEKVLDTATLEQMAKLSV